MPFTLSAAEVDATRGHQIATSFCSSCHAVAPKEMHSPVARAPAFAAVAQSSATTEMSLRTFMVTTHPNMPNIRLTPDQIDDVVVYILSLANH
ncbi:MAG TPA: c-type cytochrome [Candidatus Cybelea sp.]|nr:c-type cytochrome [Candidatus Cybelea sp.]